MVTGGTLQYRLDASNPASASGTAVNSWNDISGNGRNFAVSGGNTAPTLVNNASPTGLPMVQFNGTTDILNYAGDAPNAQTVIIVNTPAVVQPEPVLGGIWGHISPTTDNGIRLATNIVNVPAWRGWPNNPTANTDNNDFAGETGSNSGIPLYYQSNTYISNGAGFDSNTADFGSFGAGPNPRGQRKSILCQHRAGRLLPQRRPRLGRKYRRGARLQHRTHHRAASSGRVLPRLQVARHPRAGGASGVLPSTTPVNISGGGTFDMTNGVQTIASLSSTDGLGSQVLLGSAGVLTIAGGVNNTYDGAIYATGGSVALPSGSLTLTGTGALQSNIVNNAALVFAPAAAQTQLYSGVISGNGSVTKIGDGTTQFSGNHTNTGPTFINAGKLQLVPGSGITLAAGFGADTSDGTTGSATNGTWAFNTSGLTAASVTGGSLTLTDNLGTEARSAFDLTKVPVEAFNASFVFQAGGNKVADGVTFMLQNDPRGTAALGTAGGALGYTGSNQTTSAPNGIINSVGIGLNIYANAVVLSTTGAGLYLLEGGTVASANTPPDSSFFRTGDPIQVNLSYDGTNNLKVMLEDLTNSTSYSQAFAIGNIATMLGGSSAYVGFSGGDGGSVATQTISNFDLSSGAVINNVLSPATALTIAATGTLDLNGGTQHVAALAGAGLVTNSGTSAAAFTVNGSSSTTFSGSINDGASPVSLTVSGGATLTLTGTDTYSGGTTVSGNATLIVTNSEAIFDGTSLTVGDPSAFPAPVVPSPVVSASVAVPEPATLALLVFGLGSAAIYRRYRRHRSSRSV